VSDPPPADLAALENFPTYEFPPGATLYRIYRLAHGAMHFSADGTQRFDPPPSSRRDFGSCYFAGSAIGAFLEVFGRIRPVQQERVRERALGLFVVEEEPLVLADLTDPAIVGQWGIDASLSVGGNYRMSQEWARAFAEFGFAGIHYAARFDPSLRERSVAIFGPPSGVLGPDAFPSNLDLKDFAPIPDTVLDAAEHIYGIVVAPDAPLP
jgi:hypothetical protein